MYPARRYISNQIPVQVIDAIFIIAFTRIRIVFEKQTLFSSPENTSMKYSLISIFKRLKPFDRCFIF